MKRTIPFLLFLGAYSAVSGYLMSNMSWVGRLGINLMHKEYKFLKTWWQGGAVVYVVLLLLFGIQLLIQKGLPNVLSKIVHVLLFGAAVYGFYFTYSDFSDDWTHKLLREVFHVGAYMFWFGWMLISIFFLSERRKPTMPGNTATTAG